MTTAEWMVIVGIALPGTLALWAALVWAMDRSYGLLWALPAMCVAVVVYVALGVNVGNAHRHHTYHVALAVVAASSVVIAAGGAAVVVGVRRKSRHGSGQRSDQLGDRRALLLLNGAAAVGGVLGVVGGHGAGRALSAIMLALSALLFVVLLKSRRGS